jgi:signal recognition particle receptor subunit beta
MVFFNYSTMQMAAKVVYYGPGLGGKTTNLQHIYGHTASDSRGEMVSLETETDRTLFFDLLPIDVGQIGGFNTRIQLYTVPGQVFYNTTRKLVLKGVDGVVFVADSQRPMLQANIESFRNLEENLAEMGLSLEELPVVLQFNKRDLPDVLSIDELNQALNRGGWPYFEASALKGNGVFETLKGVSKLTLLTLKKRLAKGAETSRPARPARAAAAHAHGASSPAGSGAGAAPSGVAAARSAAPPATPATAAATAAPPAPAAAAPALAAPPAAAAAAAATVAVPAPPLAPASQAGARPAPAPTPLAPSAPPAVPGPAPAPPPPAAARPAGSPPLATKRRELDVLGELERIRKQALRPAAEVTASRPIAIRPGTTSTTNGTREINRDLQLTLKRSDFQRTRRFTVTLQVEDGEHRVVDAIRDLQVDVQDVAALAKVLLRLNIAVAAKE